MFGHMIEVSTKALLDFKLRVFMDGEVCETPFSALLGERTLVSLYMRNNTGGCDCQMRLLAGMQEELAASGWTLIGISKDTPGSHEKYAAKLGIRFPLVSDPEHAFAMAMDAMVQKRMYGRSYEGPLRSAYALDENGCVLGILDKVKTKSYDEQVREFIAGL